ncbi:uncharacterized protein MYCFIDRAFT_82801 [Pseudocercospora fijiensis CIRAD86]|uniref:Uncharacterized protein n=1 Tax=Pseudocercospora fijiensis (strain CIRAD86) TaxID=383855 RepID=M3B7Z3_PSEFD|nr:uncharacterized protein MYCFIDRAFT_82801 [Pseudocercospora fijiensis CIRAD86]EME85442.1 hypothetical protein MYCFIDRAFT_82801 [Pseudocercospora fijiensis CIRAD86]
MSATSAPFRVPEQKKPRTRPRMLDGYISENHGAVVPVSYLFVAPEQRAAQPSGGAKRVVRDGLRRHDYGRFPAQQTPEKAKADEMVLVWCLHAWHDNHNHNNVARSLFYLWKAWPYITGYFSSICTLLHDRLRGRQAGRKSRLHARNKTDASITVVASAHSDEAGHRMARRGGGERRYWQDFFRNDSALALLRQLQPRCGPVKGTYIFHVPFETPYPPDL